MNSRLLSLILLLSISAIHVSHASTSNDTIDGRHWKIQKELLKEGHSKYLTTIYNKKDKLMSMFIWNRIVHLKENELTLTQHIVNSDSTKNMFAFSICNRADLKPIYHKTKSNTRIAAFNFEKDKIIRADSVVGNGVPADFKVESSVMPYNWELDIELLGILPYKSGKSFFVNFYHPGSKQLPQYYEYKVIGTEPIKSLDNKEISCWKVRIDYSFDSYAIFWISTKTKKVLQVKDIWGGGYRYKQLISIE